jgi:hypothetical protein
MLSAMAGGTMVEWFIAVSALSLLVASFIRSGWTRGIRDPVTFIATGLLCAGLRNLLDARTESSIGLAFTTAEIAAMACAFYFLWRRGHPRGGNAA